MTEVDSRTGPSRRSLFKAGAGVAGLAAFATLNPFEALSNRADADPSSPRRPRAGVDYGPLGPVKDEATGLELLHLPNGFRYISYGWTGDPMKDGVPTPSSHDGMAAFRAQGGNVALVRNHERGTGTPFTAPAYDPGAGGGTTNLLFDPRAGKWLESYASLSGTIRNCAGGPTPWDSWITCEETTEVVNGVRHGYVFDVPADGKGDPVPLRDAGRFSHEAVAIDPSTGVMYITEDATPSGLYRYLAPKGAASGGADKPGLKKRTWAPGGTLQMMRLGDGGSVSTYADPTGTEYDVSWVDIPNPDYAPGEQRPALQGQVAGAAVFTRGEGAWFADGILYFVSTSGGPVGQGQVFAYDPKREKLRVLFASPAANVLNAPDNITVSPRGGIVLCEDGSGDEYLHGLTTGGDIFQFALNRAVVPAGGIPGKSVPAGNYSGSEWCGACFDPKGDWLFANLQSPGLTVAITGPWREGSL